MLLGDADRLLVVALLAQEVVGYGRQRALGPREEPVDDGVVDEAGEVAAAAAQRLACGAHGQHDVEVVQALVDEVVPLALLVERDAAVLALLAHAVDQRDALLLGEETRHHARRQHVVDHLQEALVLDVRVGEEEDDRRAALVGTELLVELLEVVLELLLRVEARERDLEDAVLRREGRELGQRLLARAADADQQRVAAREAQDAVDARQVLERVLEQHQVQRRVLPLVEVVEHVLEDAAQLRVVLQVLVHADVLLLVADEPEEIGRAHV